MKKKLILFLLLNLFFNENSFSKQNKIAKFFNLKKFLILTSSAYALYEIYITTKIYGFEFLFSANFPKDYFLVSEYHEKGKKYLKIKINEKYLNSVLNSFKKANPIKIPYENNFDIKEFENMPYIKKMKTFEKYIINPENTNLNSKEDIDNFKPFLNSISAINKEVNKLKNLHIHNIVLNYFK